MVTASHNPAKYNGYKAYGPDGCQMTDEAANIVYAEIQNTDILNGAKIMSFEEGMAAGLIEYVGEDCKEALYEEIKARSVRPGICETAGLKLVYSPLNGSGLVFGGGLVGSVLNGEFRNVPHQFLIEMVFRGVAFGNGFFESLGDGQGLCGQVQLVFFHFYFLLFCLLV